jgi:long-chain acyl-CoA synthetase
MPLSQILIDSARRWPRHTALVCGSERLSHGELHRRVMALAGALKAQAQVQPGERVALMLDNSPEMACALHAVWYLGAVCVTINPLTRSDKLQALLASTRASVLLTQASLAPVWQPVLAGAPSVRCVFVAGSRDTLPVPGLPWPAQADDGAQLQATAVDDHTLALISHTSGTTGLPKGVMLSHGNLLHATAAIASYLTLDDTDVIVSALPLSFNYGLTQLLLGMTTGATLVLERNFAFPVKVLDTLVRERGTVFPGVPTMYAMLTALKDRSRHDLSALRTLTNAAAALPPAVIDRLRDWLPQARLFAMYGQTECTRISYLPPDELAARPGSVGRGLPGQTWWLIDEHGQRLPDAAPNARGELVVQGPHVMLGYWERPEETARKLQRDPQTGQLSLHTGDVFHTDADGYLYFEARQDDIIKSRGEKVSPREVEEVIVQLEAVLECAVLGTPDELLGQAVKALVVLREGAALSERDVTRHCMAHLESYMVPKVVEFVRELPKTDTGKIRRSALR